MPALAITKAYSNGNLLFEAHLDNFKTALETLLNTTLLDSTNVQVGGLTGSNLATGTITATQLADGSIGTSQIADNSVTAVKLSAYVTQSSSTVNTATVYDGSGGNQSLGTTASFSYSGLRPVMVFFKPSSSNNLCQIAGTFTGSLRITSANGDLIQEQQIGFGTAYKMPLSQFSAIYFPSAAGSTTYTVTWIPNPSDSITVSGIVSALEL